VSTQRFTSMGCEIVIGGADTETREAVEALFAARDQLFSRFRIDSELNSVNGRAGRPLHVSEEFASMLGMALAVARESDGLVVPTVGAALEAAGYAADFIRLRDDGRAPQTVPVGDWRAVQLVGRLLSFPYGVKLDLNGVVKGKTVDDAVAVLPGDGFVSAGGDIAVRGGAVVALPEGEVVRLVCGALATSGTDRRRWRRGGLAQHHLIDPRTGRPSRARWKQVSACGASCLAADTAAKAGFLLDGEGPDWLDERGIPARFVALDGEIVTNAAWRAFVPEHACT
jgi:thiamine biosynthesis lipoprotein